ncbi:MAG: UvrD-helicase domain-containing protein [Candidatus Liptonbacteria bacterium]|nr:UvrD-helicase domain-containing protein [Candidatus Liptonbacteria bacterium]
MLPQNLNKKQMEAVESPEGPLLIVAGAGSGKTRTLTSRLQYLLSKNINPSSIIAITFTNKAADEMRGRVQKFIGSNQPFIGTFHSLGARILRRETASLGRGANFSIFDSDDSLSAIKKTIKTLALLKQDKAGPTMFRFYISKIKNDLLRPSDLLEGTKLANLEAVYEEYENQLKRINAFDFDDLIEKPVKLFARNPTILNEYRERFKYILVDEFQDVNTAQYQFIKLLAKEHKNINVVGDDAQSIYKFRGANFQHFLNFESDWPNAKVVFLEENYRSTGNIISAASAVVGENKLQKQKNLWTRNPAGAPISIMEHRDEIGEAEWIANNIKNPYTAEPSETVRGRTRSGFRQISKIKNKEAAAILYRTNAQSRAIEQALIERGISYQIFGSIRFYERKEIKDLVACLRYAWNPKDLISLERLSKNFLKKPYLILQAELPQRASGQAALSPYELLIYVINTTKYFDYLKQNYPNAEERAENIKELLNFASAHNDLGGFLEKITLLQSNDDQNSRVTTTNNKSGRPVISNKLSVVNLMTIHIAKGLEFDRIYLAGCNEGLLPHQMSYSSPDEIEEERRLMYVAMTRAKQELILSFYDVGSRFLYEIPPELIKFQSALKSEQEEFLDDEERYIVHD